MSGVCVCKSAGPHTAIWSPRELAKLNAALRSKMLDFPALGNVTPALKHEILSNKRA